VKLDLRLIVPGPAAGTILLAEGGVLPSAELEGDEDEATVVAVTAYLRDIIGLRVPVLETHPRWLGVPPADPIPTLAMTEMAPRAWPPSPPLAFGPIPTTLDGVPGSLVPRARELLTELGTGAQPPALRPRWARPGWQARASGWMIAAAADAGRPLISEPAPFYLRGISALLRAETATGAAFLKAVFPPFHAEPVVTGLLAERVPASLPVVLAIEPDEGWLLVEDVGAPLVGEMPAAERAVGLVAGSHAIVELQRRLTGDLDALALAGCPLRPLDEMAALLDAAIGPDGIALGVDTLAPERRDRAVAATRAAVKRVAGLGFPTTVVHGDFHPGNVMLVGDRPVIIDWSDAAIGNPLVDLITWLSWSKDEPDQEQLATDAWIDAWAAGTGIDAAAVREAIDDILLVGAAYQVISYDGILAALEPSTRYTLADGATGFLKRLEGLIREA
jgi:aminoglycoside/choline kinase family phosphotransferase